MLIESMVLELLKPIDLCKSEDKCKSPFKLYVVYHVAYLIAGHVTILKDLLLFGNIDRYAYMTAISANFSRQLWLLEFYFVFFFHLELSF